MTSEERDEVKQVVQEVLQKEGVAIDDNTIFPMKNSAGQADALLMMQLDQQHQATDYSRINVENLPEGGGGITIDQVPTEDSPNAVASGGVYDALEEKQESLTSGINIKTVNGQSILGSGNLVTESDIVPFDGFVLLSPITIIDGSAVDPDAILYYRDANRFVAKKGNSYYNNWENREVYNDGNHPYTTKIYLYGNMYMWDGTDFSAKGGGSEQIQSDWNQTDSTKKDYIKNKPTIPDTSDYYTKQESDAKYQPKGNYQPAGDYATKTDLNGKVDNIPGKGLSTNDYTDADKQKVAAAITEHQDISGKANISDVEAALALKANKRDVNDGLDLKANKSSVYTKDETYNKTELNNMITTPDQKFVTVTATSQTTDVTTLLPDNGEADTIYRVGNWDGTQYDVSRYTEYAWDGTDYVPLDVKEYTLATEEDFDNPNPSSADKVPTVGAIQGWSGMKHIENPEFPSVLTDNNDKIIAAVKKDGSIFFGAGVPQQVRDFVELVAQELYKSKVDKEDGKSLIDEEYADGTTYEDYTEYAEIIIDKVGKMIEGIRKSGEHVFNSNGIEINGNGISIIDNPEYTFVVLDAKNRVLFGSKVNGGFSSSELDSSAIKQYVDTQIDEDNMERYKGILSTLNRTSSKISGGVPTNIYSNLVLACMTDPHNMRPAVIRFCNFVKRFKDYFNDAICLGDVVSGQFDHYTPEYNSIDGYNNILLALGNHDAYDNESLETVLPESDCYAQYYNGLIENWGVTYTQGKCYYYKDYTHQNIRLVMVDCMHWDSTQRTWFVNTLNDAKTAGLHVVVGSHIPIISDISDITPFDGCTFVSMDFLSTHYDTPTRDIPSIVDSFMQDGGVFACYLFGHWHADYVGTYTQYPNQIVIVQACAANFTFHRDTAYDTKYFEDQFSIYSFDSYYKFIRVLRVGAPYDRNLRHKESMLITYDVSVENKLLSNF